LGELDQPGRGSCVAAGNDTDAAQLEPAPHRAAIGATFVVEGRAA
jgi:hypothetical protein